MRRVSVVKTPRALVNGDVAADAMDDALAERARAGDPESFELLYQRHKLDVWNLAFFTLRDHHDAEDAVQETFLKAYRALAQHRRGDSLRRWLLAICRNVCVDRIRVRGARPAVALEDEGMPVRADDVDGRVDLHRALARMTSEEREAFLLVDVLGCTSDEATRIVGLRAASTMRSRVARARRTLAEDLAPAPELYVVRPWTNAG